MWERPRRYSHSLMNYSLNSSKPSRKNTSFDTFLSFSVSQRVLPLSPTGDLCVTVSSAVVSALCLLSESLPAPVPCVRWQGREDRALALGRRQITLALDPICFRSMWAILAVTCRLWQLPLGHAYLMMELWRYRVSRSSSITVNSFS